MFEIFQTALTGSQLSASALITGVTTLWTLGIRYIAINKSFPHHLNSFDNVPVNYKVFNGRSILRQCD